MVDRDRFVTDRCPVDCFADDGIHLNDDGRVVDADLIRSVTGV